MQQRAPRVVICLTTHDRVDCARINLGILKRTGEHIQRLIGATDFAYSDPGAKRY